MAKIGKIENNNKRRRLAAQYAQKRATLKAMANDKSLSSEERFKARLKLSKLPRNSAPVRVRNRCELTGRPRGYYRKTKLCRNMLRDMASKGLIPGMVKSSW